MSETSMISEKEPTTVRLLVSISVKEPPLVKVVIVGFCLFMFATFAALGEGQRYAVTGALFDF